MTRYIYRYSYSVIDRTANTVVRNGRDYLTIAALSCAIEIEIKQLGEFADCYRVQINITRVAGY